MLTALRCDRYERIIAFIQKHLPDPFYLEGIDRISIRGAILREIHRADELGSGMRNMMKYGKAYGGEDPEMIEGDVSRTIVKYPDSAEYEEDSAATGGAAPEVTPEVGKMLMVIQGEMSRAEIQHELGLTDAGKRLLESMQE